jgi:integrase
MGESRSGRSWRRVHSGQGAAPGGTWTRRKRTQVDLRGRELWVRQTLTPGRPEALESRLDTPKSNRERRVDLNVQACRVLEDLRRATLAEMLAGASARPLRFVFNQGGEPLAAPHVRAAFARILHVAELPEHFTPHALRHSYAIHLLQRNTPIVYVKEQLGHSSITVTVDTCGRWLPTGDKQYVDALDQPEGAGEARAAAATSAADDRPPGRVVTNW